MSDIDQASDSSNILDDVSSEDVLHDDQIDSLNAVISDGEYFNANCMADIDDENVLPLPPEVTENIIPAAQDKAMNDSQFSVNTLDSTQSTVLDPVQIPEPIITDEKVEWIVDMKVDLKPNNEFHEKYVSNKKILWKGLKWFLIVQVTSLNDRQYPGALSTYVGHSGVPEEERCQLGLAVEFKFTLLTKDLKPFRETKSSTYEFSLENANSEDRGFRHGFEERRDGEMPFNQYDLSFMRFQGKETTLFIKVELNERFQVRSIPHSYNSKMSTGMVGLENLGATCYLNSLLQMLFHINAFRKAVYQLPHLDEVYGSSTTLALQNVFHQLQISDREVKPTGNFKDLLTAFGWNIQDAFAQQDVQEMMRILLDKLEEKMKGTVVDGVIKSLFSGCVRSFIKCVNVNYTSNREEEFYDIQLDVKGCKDIYESFTKYVAKEMLDGDNQYEAGDFGKQNAEKGVIFTKFPPVLTILLKRFDFDLIRMRFIKIHDEYKFYTKINLNAYIAEDAPKESKEKRYNYVLHSVLVHMGDVGGGHYYCYIRPSIGYSYEDTTPQDDTSDSQATNISEVIKTWPSQEITPDSDGVLRPIVYANNNRKVLSHRQKSKIDGKWFKFNDETVYEVREYEAVDYSYGRSLNQSNRGVFTSLSISSAYMLIYILESEAKDIMKEVVIPDDLSKRLENENHRRIVDLKRMQMRQMYKIVRYATEYDIARFQDYNRFQDFISEDSLPTLCYIQHSTKHTILLRVADRLGCSPRLLRLYALGKITRRSNALRPVEEITAHKLMESIESDEIFYVHIADASMKKRRQDTVYDTSCKQCKDAERKWLDDLRSELTKQPEFLRDANDKHENNGISSDFPDEIDIVEGCGIMCNNEPVLHLLLSNQIKAKLSRQISQINEMYSNALSTYVSNQMHSNEENCEFIGFFKIFDPFNIISPCDDVVSSKLREHPLHTRGKPTDFQPITIDFDTLTQNQPSNGIYIPLKYIGCFSIPDDATLLAVLEKLSGLVDKLYSHHGMENAPERFQVLSHQNMILTLCTSPMGFGHDIQQLHEDSSVLDTPFFDCFPSYKELGNIISGVFIYEIDMKSLNDNEITMKSYLPFDSLRCSKDWLMYMSTKKSFHIEPLGSLDLTVMVKAMVKRHDLKRMMKEDERQTQQALLESSKEVLKRKANEILNDAHVTNSKSIESNMVENETLDGDNVRALNGDESRLTTRIMTNDGDIQSDSGSSGSESEDSMLSSLSSDVEFSMDPQFNSTRINSKGIATKLGYLDLDLPGNMSLRDVVAHIHKQFKCAPDVGCGNMVFYAISDRESHNDINSVKPMVSHDMKSLDNYLTDRKPITLMGNRQPYANSSQYSLYYQILPFSLLNGDNDLRSKIRFLEVFIIDNRIREWRRRYLHFKTVNGTLIQNNESEEYSNKRRRIDTNDGTFITNTLPYPTASDEGTCSNAIWPETTTTIPAHPDFISDYRIFLRAKMDMKIYEFVNTLRSIIAIPKNINKDGELCSPINNSSTKSSVHGDIHTTSDNDHKLETVTQINESSIDNADKIKVDSFTTESTSSVSSSLNSVINQDISRSNETLRATLSDSGEMQNTASNIAVNVMKSDIHTIPIKKAYNKTRNYDIVSEDVNLDNPHASKYPLVLLSIVDNVIDDIYPASLTTKQLPHSWIEAYNDLATSNKHRIGVQHVSMNDLEFMRGDNPLMRSTMVSVFSFTLLGSACNPWPFYSDESLQTVSIPGPIITYVKEDDDYDTLCRRIADILGESIEEALKYKLAIVHKRIPTFITRYVNGHINNDKRAISPSVHQNNNCANNSTVPTGFFKSESNHEISNNSNQDNGQPPPSVNSPISHHNGNIWALLTEKYPHYTQYSYDVARAVRTNGPMLRNQIEKNPYPSIGIQRSSVKSTSPRIYRPSSGIKISG